jgi:hypothetical protein
MSDVSKYIETRKKSDPAFAVGDDTGRTGEEIAYQEECHFKNGEPCRRYAVLISEDDWDSIQETLYLTSIPGMRESIINGMKEPLSESIKELSW